MTEFQTVLWGTSPTVVIGLIYAAIRYMRSRAEVKRIESKTRIEEREASIDEWVRLHQQDVRDMADLRLRFAQMELRLERTQAKLNQYVQLFASMAAHIKALESKLKDMNVPIDPWKFEEVLQSLKVDE